MLNTKNVVEGLRGARSVEDALCKMTPIKIKWIWLNNYKNF